MVKNLSVSIKLHEVPQNFFCGGLLTPSKVGTNFWGCLGRPKFVWCVGGGWGGNHHFTPTLDVLYCSFNSLESGMVHYKNRNSLMISLPRKGKMESYIMFLEGQNRNHRLYFCFYKSGFNLLTILLVAECKSYICF